MRRVNLWPCLFSLLSLSALAEDEVNIQLQLLECRAQLEHWQGVARICELSKQEELQDLQTQCDQEIQSLHEAIRGEARKRKWKGTFNRLCSFIMVRLYFLFSLSLSDVSFLLSLLRNSLSVWSKNICPTSGACSVEESSDQSRKQGVCDRG